MIPKRIHYCWFGGAEKPEKVKKCIDSWKAFCPDYEIFEWNEKNFDFEQIPYMAQAYEAKKYAFVSDVARLIIVYNEGGIYFDTDVELVKSPDELLKNKAFMGFENDNFVASGLGFGAEAGLPILGEHIEIYREIPFLLEDGSFNMTACTHYTTDLLSQKGLLKNGRLQTVEDITIYPEEYFNPLDSLTGKLRKTKNTYSIHWYLASWENISQTKLKIHRVIRRLFGTKKIEAIKGIFGNK